MCREVIERLVRCFESEPTGEPDGWRAQVAAAALMVECARVDSHFNDVERRAIAAAARELFDLEPDVADMLVAVAERRADDVWHDWLFTESIKRSFGPDERAALVRKLCQLAHVNGDLQRHEDAFVRRIARELQVPDEVLAEARRSAAAERPQRAQ
jgi:uncharacterized tellurite resistance protein B-like protein